MSKDLQVGDWIHNKSGNFVSKVTKIERKKGHDGSDHVWYHGPRVNDRKKVPTLGKTLFSTHHSEVTKINKPKDVQEETGLKTFTELSEQLSGTEEARQKLKKAKKGDTMSFSHHKHGEVAGEYHGLKRMGAHSYASVSVKGKGKFYVPLHQVQHHPKPKVTEEVEEIDEVSAATLQNYMGKAKQDGLDKTQAAHDEWRGAGFQNTDKAKELSAKGMKRYKGITAAKRSLTRKGVPYKKDD